MYCSEQENDHLDDQEGDGRIALHDSH